MITKENIKFSHIKKYLEEFNISLDSLTAPFDKMPNKMCRNNKKEKMMMYFNEHSNEICKWVNKNLEKNF